MRERAVLFDLDNTLNVRRTDLVKFLNHQYRERRLSAVGVSLDYWVERFLELDCGGKIWKDEVYRELVQESTSAVNYQTLLSDYEFGFARFVTPRPGLHAVISELSNRGWRLGIITNGRSSFQRRTLEALEIASSFGVVIVSEECGLRKPDKAIFELALDQLGCSASGSWFVGDDYAADIVGARTAGLNALWIREAASEEHEISTLSEVLDYVPK